MSRAVPDALRGLPNFRGGKILVYPHAEMELTAIEEFSRLGTTDPRFVALADISARHEGIWSEEAEKYLLDAFTRNAATVRWSRQP